MKTVFTIGEAQGDRDRLLFELGRDYCNYAFVKDRNIQLIRYLSFEEWEADQSLAAILKELQEQDFQSVFVCSALATALLVPQTHFNGKYNLLDIIYDLPKQFHLNDPVPEWQIVNMYSIPVSFRQLVLAHFPDARFYHAYTPALKIYNGFVAPDQIDIHFSTGQFRVLVKKENNIQLAQIYSYKTPLDVIYYLLRICYEFDLVQSDVFLIVSGLIDKDSALFKELHNYFLNLHFAQAPDYILPETEHPHYYFTSLYNLAACVS